LATTPYNEDFTDSEDFEDLSVEFSSDSPDLDSIEELIEGKSDIYEKGKLDLRKIVHEGKLVNILNVEFRVLFMIGGNSNIAFLSKLRQIGENIIIITNHLPSKFMKSKHSFKIFKSIDGSWRDKTVVDPCCLFYLITSTVVKDYKFWEEMLNCVLIDPEYLQSKLESSIGVYRKQAGVISDPYNNSLQELNREIAETMDLLEERKRTKEKINLDANVFGGKKKLLTKYEVRIKELGLNEGDYARFFRRVKSESDYTWEDFLNSIDKFSPENNEQMSEAFGKKLDASIMKKKRPFEHELIHQVPIALGGGRRRRNANSRIHLKEPRLCAEMASFHVDLLSKIISGTLYMSSRTLKRWKTQFKIYTMLEPHFKKNKKGKSFLLNLMRLIVNDAKLTDENDEDKELWENLYDLTNFYMVEDEDDESSDGSEQAFNEEPGEGSIGYRPKRTFES
jgi:hypothetical protein